MMKKNSENENVLLRFSKHILEDHINGTNCAVLSELGLYQECSKKFYQPGNHKLQAGNWLKKTPSPKPARARAHVPLENFKNQRSQIS